MAHREPGEYEPDDRNRQLREEPLREREQFRAEIGSTKGSTKGSPYGSTIGSPYGSTKGSPYGSTDYARENWRSGQPSAYEERTGGGGFDEGFGSGRTGGRFGFSDPAPRSGGDASADDASSRYGGFSRTTSSGRFTGRGPKGYRRSDERIREDICERLEDHGDVDASDIEVRVENGEVTLDGKVDSREEKRLAEDLVEFTAGVKHVNNQLRVEKGFFARIFGGSSGDPGEGQR